MKTVKDISKKFDIPRVKVYEAIQEGLIPAEKKEVVPGIKKYWTVSDETFNNLDGEEIKSNIYEGVAREKVTTLSDLVKITGKNRGVLNRLIHKGIIPAHKEKVRGSRKSFVIEEEFMNNHSTSEIVELVRNNSRGSKEEKGLKGYFSIKELAENFDISVIDLRRILAELKDEGSDCYDIKIHNGIYYMSVDDAVKLNDDDIEKFYKKYIEEKDFDIDNEWKELLDLWYKKYHSDKILSSDVLILAKKNGLLSEFFGDDKTYIGEASSFGRLINKKASEDVLFDEYKIETVDKVGEPNKYMLKKLYLFDKDKKENKNDVVVEDDNEELNNNQIRTTYYIYKVFAAGGKKALKNRMFTFTACDGDDGSWISVNKELDKVKRILKKNTSFNKEQLCDYRGKDINLSEKEYLSEDDYWYFTTIPEAEFSTEFIFSIHSRDERGNYFQYYVSPYKINWLEGLPTVEIYEGTDIDYTLEVLKEKHPEFSGDLELIEELIRKGQS